MSNTYTFIIGTMDDFDSVDDLIDYVEINAHTGDRNYSVFEFDEPTDLPEDTLTLIGRGIAFSNDWAMDDTYSFLVRGSVVEDESTGRQQVDKGLIRYLAAQCSEV
jgi:hypothetical protein